MLTGKITIMLEINKEIKDKSLSCNYRMVTFSDEETDKKTIINQPTIEFQDDYKFIETKDGTIIHRTCSNYINHGTMPIFMDQWLTDENTAIVKSLNPNCSYETANYDENMPSESMFAFLYTEFAVTKVL